MRHSSLVLIATLIGMAPLSAGVNQNNALVGRWFGTGPTGYGIIDRYGDGRWAAKSYLRYGTGKPAEVNVCWGRWKLRGTQYSTILLGASSPTLRRFGGRWGDNEGPTDHSSTVFLHNRSWLCSARRSTYRFAPSPRCRSQTSKGVPLESYDRHYCAFSTRHPLVDQQSARCPCHLTGRCS